MGTTELKAPRDRERAFRRPRPGLPAKRKGTRASAEEQKRIDLSNGPRGGLFEEMGRPAEAKDAYSRFIEAWKDADPQL